MASQRRRAIVIGNSDGIGLALTRRLLAAGWTVSGVSRSPSVLAAPEYHHTVADVTSPEYPELLTGAVDRLGGTDLCVYAAGIGEPVDVHDLAAQTRVIEVNLMGAARTIGVVAPRMVTAKAGHIIGLSSLADEIISGDATGYMASKCGLTSYLSGLSLALRPHGVAVTTVRFGFVATKMAKGTTRPFMISPERATDVLLRCLRTRPAVVSFPRKMALLVRVLHALTAIQLRMR